MAIGGIPPGGSGASGAPPTLADALAGLKAGDVVTARVQQAVANTARLAIGRAVIDVLTQVALKPGTTVALQVQRSDSGVTLQVVQPEAGQAQQTTAQTARPLPAVTQQPQVPQGGQSPAQPPAPQTAQSSPPQAPSGAPQHTAPRAPVPTPSAAGQQPVIVQAAQTGTPTQTVSAGPPQAPASAANPPSAAQPGVPAQAPPTVTGQQPQPAQPGSPAQPGTPQPSSPAPALPAGTGAPASAPPPVTVVAGQTGGQPQVQPAPGIGSTAQGTTTPQPAGPGNVTPQAAAPPQSPQPATPRASATPPPANTSPGSPQPQSSAPIQQTPQTQQVEQVQAVATARAQAASVQTGLAPVFSSLEAVLNQPGRPRLEPSVEAAARQLLGLKVPSEKLAEPASLQSALRASGPYLEAALARGLAPPQGDLKNALLALRNVLKSVLGDTAPRLPATGGQTHPVPDQGSNPQAQRPAPPSIPQGADAAEIMRQLAADTEGALARVRLLQIASLPDADGVPRQDGTPENQPRVWQMEVPIGTGREASVMGIRIERDKRAKKGDRGDGTVWRVRLALELEDAGAISAAIAYAPPQVSVSIWAEQPETSRILRDNAGLLDDALRAAELDVDGIDVQTGRAPDTKRPRSALPVGGLYDREG